MNLIAHSKIIQTAVAAPGSGKTEALITQIPNLLSAGKNIVLALPTIKLCKSVTERCDGKIPYKLINSETCNYVTSTLETSLTNRYDNFLITTHESIFKAEAKLLSGWILVVDELPKVVDFQHFPFDSVELDQLFAVTEEIDGKILIRAELIDTLTDALKTYRADSAGGERTSMLSRSGADIYQSLLEGHPVFIDSVTAKGIRHIRPIVEMSFWDTLAEAEEVHVLAANIKGSLFEIFSEIHGFAQKKSRFTPDFEGYSCPITIYPIVQKNKIYSKSLALKSMTGLDCQNHKGLRDGQAIDVMMKNALFETSGKPLLFKNGWAEFNWLLPETITICSADSRGLNQYMAETCAILLFGGNPSPSDKLALDYLSTKYSRDFTQAFITTRLLEPSLQAVTRTAIRDRENTKPVKLFVQDERVANYLISTHLQKAVIDWSLSENTPEFQDRRTIEDERKAPAMALLKEGKKIKEISKITNCHRNTISNWKKELAA